MEFPVNLDVDAFSNLPSNVVDMILSHLPLNEAVRTSVLSKEWRFKWTYIPTIAVDDRLRQESPSEVETAVYHVLSRHMGQIVKFCLNITCYSSRPHIDNWIHLLRNHRVEDFTISLICGKKHFMPSCFFGFQHLRHLNLSRCVFRPPLGFAGLVQLVTLDFQDVEFVPVAFLKLISRCLLLEKIRLVDCTKWDSVEVEAPGLRIFFFHGAFKSIRFKNCPSLAEVSLSITSLVPVIKAVKVIIQRFEFLHTLERLHIHPFVLKSLRALGSPNGLPQGLHRLKALNLSLFLDNMEEIEFALGLVRASENLQMLRVSLYVGTIDEGVLEFIKAQQPSLDLRLAKLRKLVFGVFSFTEPQMALARLLVASAPMLEEMVISTADVPVGNPESKFMELKQCLRASPGACIVLETQ